MKKTDKKNRMRDRKSDVDIVDWLLAIDLDQFFFCHNEAIGTHTIQDW